MRSCPSCQRSYSDDMDFCPRDATPLRPAVSATEAHVAAGLSRRYRIVKRLGEGGMGTVFLAEQIAVGNRLVALKVLRRKLLDDPEFLQRFRDEPSSTGRISHRNVVTVYECGQADDGSPYIAMEYLEGESLREVLRRRQTLSPEPVAEILTQAARGLNAAHKLGIIHRDLKPDNIFLSHDDEGKPLVKILDFGIAKMRESSTHTLTGLAIGTPQYMSVEQAGGMRSDEMDGRSDIYSLGIVVYEMLAGRPPFDADTPMAYIRKHLVDPPIPLRQARPESGISPAVETAVMKALQKNRDERYTTAPEFASVFAQSVQSAPAPQLHPPAGIIRPSPPKAPPNQRAKYTVGAIALLGVLLAASLGWYYFGVRHKHAAPPVSPPAATQTSSQRASPPLAVTQQASQSSPEAQPPRREIVEDAPKVRRERQSQYAPASNPPTAPPNAGTPPKTNDAVAESQSSNTSSQPSPDAAAKVKAATAIGDLLFKRGEYDEAIVEYQKGLQVSPSDSTLREKIGQAQKAKAAWQRVNQQ